ncbi:MAG: hypothetical protein HFJ45_10295 [Clostridia bacterium]|nr:hypothetical protein [Clostridia bacterium]
MQVFMLFIGTMLLVIGVKLIYDARLIVNKYFSVNDRNSATIVLKITGTICVFIGAIFVSKYL